MKKITPFLWFDGNAEEALEFYTTVFKNSKTGKVVRYGPHGPGKEGSIMTARMQLEDQEFMLLNGGPHYKFNEAVSFFVKCSDQAEVDYYWEKLLEGGGSELMCGWMKDKFGLTWQIIPEKLESFLHNPDPEKSSRAMNAMLKMKKIEIGVLESAIA